VDHAEEESDQEPGSEGESLPDEDIWMENLDEGTWLPDSDGTLSSIECTHDSGQVLIWENSLYVNYALGRTSHCCSIRDR